MSSNTDESPLHILMFSDHTIGALGGVQTSMRAQIEELLRRGHRVTLAMPMMSKPKNILSHDNLAIIELKRIPMRFNGYDSALPFARPQLKLIERELRHLPAVDVVHSQGTITAGCIAILAARKMNLPLVQTFHTREDVFAEQVQPFPSAITTAVRHHYGRYIPLARIERGDMSRPAHNAWTVMLSQAAAADYVTFPSRYFLQMMRTLGMDRPATVVSNGIQDTIVDGISTDDIERQGCVWVGRLSVEKNPDLFIEIARRLPDIPFTLIGTGPLLSKLRKAAPKNVQFITDANQTAAIKIVHRSELLIHTSYGFDNQPMVLLEAACAGTPGIICDPNLLETAPEPGTKLVTSNATAFAHAIRGLHVHPRQLRTMRKAQYERRDGLRQSAVTSQMVCIYRQVIASRYHDVVRTIIR